MPEINGAFPILPYPDPRAAIAWLERAFGAVAVAVHPPQADRPLEHAEVRVGAAIVMPTHAAGTGLYTPAGPTVLYVVVADPDALCARARAAGAEIVAPLGDREYGSRDFAARDLGGNLWCFGTYRPGGVEPGSEPPA